MHIDSTRSKKSPQALACAVGAIVTHFAGLLTPRQEYVVCQIVSGRSFEDLAEELHLYEQRVLNIYYDSIDKIANIQNLLEAKETEIAQLKETVKELKSNSVSGDTKNLFLLLFTPIKNIAFSNRLKHALSTKVTTVLDLVSMSRKEVLSIKAIGKSSMDELDEWLLTNGLSYEMNIDEYLN